MRGLEPRAAIDEQGGAGDGVGVVAGRECRRVTDVLGAPRGLGRKGAGLPYPP
jgi:hypothetical protein